MLDLLPEHIINIINFYVWSGGFGSINRQYTKLFEYDEEINGLYTENIFFPSSKFGFNYRRNYGKHYPMIYNLRKNYTNNRGSNLYLPSNY